MGKSSIKRAFLLLLLLCLVPLGGLAHQRGFGQFAMDDVNVRKSPGGEILFKKQKGEELFILSWKERGGHTWYEVHTHDAIRTNPVTAWVRGDMVAGPEQLFSGVVEAAAFHDLLIALKQDGTVAVGGRTHKYARMMKGQHPDSWREVRQVAAGYCTVYGLKKDGSLYKWGINGPDSGIPGLRDEGGRLVPFQAIDAFDDSFLGLTEDGALYSFYHNRTCQAAPPGSGVTGFSAGSGFYDDALFLRGGRVTSLSSFYDSAISEEERALISRWRDVVKVEAGIRTPRVEGGAQADQGAPLVAAIRGDGRVVALDAAMNEEVSGWTDISDIAAGDGFLLGLSKDGRVLAAGERKHFVAGEVAAWTDMAGIACGKSFCVGLTREGQLRFAGEVQFTRQ